MGWGGALRCGDGPGWSVCHQRSISVSLFGEARSRSPSLHLVIRIRSRGGGGGVDRNDVDRTGVRNIRNIAEGSQKYIRNIS